MPDESLWIAVIIAALFIAAEMVYWIKAEYQKYIWRQKAQKPVRYPMYDKDGKYR